MPEIFDKDIGTLVQLDTEVDLLVANSVEIVAITPNSDKVTLIAEVVSSTKIQHEKTSLTLNIAGIWLLQAHAVFSANLEFYGQEVTLSVGEAITPPE